MLTITALSGVRILEHAIKHVRHMTGVFQTRFNVFKPVSIFKRQESHIYQRQEPYRSFFITNSFYENVNKNS